MLVDIERHISPRTASEIEMELIICRLKHLVSLISGHRIVEFSRVPRNNTRSEVDFAVGTAQGGLGLEKGALTSKTS